jgi:putative ABC transport system permease protein
MIRNYLKIAFRNLLKYKFISFINLFGLTVGFTCCLLILAYILNERSYDKFNTKASQIYRVTRSFNTADGIENLHLSSVAPPFGPLLQHDFPDIEKMTRLLFTGNTAFRYKDKLLDEKGVFFADENLFNFFTVPVVSGNPATALAEPRCVMMTDEVAKKYFGNEDPVNKMIRVDNQYYFKVTGIFKPFPANSHIHPEVLLSFSTLNDSAIYGEEQLRTNWGNNSFYTYLLFPENYPVEKIAAQFPGFLDKNMHKRGAAPDFKASKYTKLYLQKLTDIHLRSHLDDEAEPNGDIRRVYIFSAIALFILLIACINYMNLSTARSALRAREIGIRKVVGAQRREIIAQFLSESVLITWLALLFAWILTWLLLPSINKLSEQHLSISSLWQVNIILPVLLLPLIVGLLSGIYPALFMSAFKPILVLKGVFKVGKSSISFRQVLVIAQFAISIILIIATTVVFQQLRYMQTASLGYDKEHIVTMLTGNLGNQYQTFRNELLQNPNIKNLGRSSRIPTGRLLDDQGIEVLAGDSMRPANVDVKYVSADFDFIPTYGIQMLAGRNFSRDYAAVDTTNYIINESAVHVLGWRTPQQAIGKDIRYGGIKGKVIGVMNDFHFESMHQKIIPLLLRMPSLQSDSYGRLSIKIGSNNIQSSLNYIEKTWKKYLPETPFQSDFLDERFARLYQSEQQQGSIFTIFSCIAIFIACLGLLGLSAFAISQRIKEIGIRKVLGASVTEIVKVLSVSFLKLVLFAAVIALPIAWFTMNKWLQDFAYRIHIQWWVLLLAGILAALIALITISFQAIRAALSNPVKSLRSE